jgi:hypothetical protein
LAALVNPNNVDRSRQVEDIATDLNLIGGPVLGDRPTSIFPPPMATHLGVRYHKMARQITLQKRKCQVSMNTRKVILVSVFYAALASVIGCTIQTAVMPLAPDRDVVEICILDNPKVIIADFLPVLQDGIRRNGLRSKVYREVPSTCGYVLEYVAFQRWDFTLFMSEADIKLYNAKELVGTASYKLPTGIFGGGGLNPAKWNSTKEKLDPLLDELFQNYSSAKPR